MKTKEWCWLANLMFVLFPGSALKMKTNPKQFEYVEKEKKNRLLNYEKIIIIEIIVLKLEISLRNNQKCSES